MGRTHMFWEEFLNKYPGKPKSQLDDYIYNSINTPHFYFCSKIPNNQILQNRT